MKIKVTMMILSLFAGIPMAFGKIACDITVSKSDNGKVIETRRFLYDEGNTDDERAEAQKVAAKLCLMKAFNVRNEFADVEGPIVSISYKDVLVIQ